MPPCLRQKTSTNPAINRSRRRRIIKFTYANAKYTHPNPSRRALVVSGSCDSAAESIVKRCAAQFASLATELVMRECGATRCGPLGSSFSLSVRSPAKAVQALPSFDFEVLLAETRTSATACSCLARSKLCIPSSYKLCMRNGTYT